MSRISRILILRYKRKGDKFLCFTLFRNFNELFISLQTFGMVFRSKCSILNGQVDHINKLNLKIANM